jgi:hypothetical protein
MRAISDLFSHSRALEISHSRLEFTQFDAVRGPPARCSFGDAETVAKKYCMT